MAKFAKLFEEDDDPYESFIQPAKNTSVGFGKKEDTISTE
jgi:hypothetical protein